MKAIQDFLTQNVEHFIAPRVDVGMEAICDRIYHVGMSRRKCTTT